MKPERHAQTLITQAKTISQQSAKNQLIGPPAIQSPTNDMNGTLVIAPALLLEPHTAMGIVGGREIFDRMLRNQWLKPRIKQRKLVRYASEGSDDSR